MNIFTLASVGIKRQGKVILDQIDLEMSSSQHLAIIGPNGAGKSFLLRILSADLVPSDGEVTIFGHVFGKVSLWEIRKKVGFVSTRMAYTFDGTMPLRDVVASGYFGAYGVPEKLSNEQEAKVQEVIAEFNLSDHIDQAFATLSDGERRKALLARSLVLHPELLIFDEPCQGLDLPSRDRFLEDIDQIATQIPIVYVTHHLEELPSCITDVVLLKEGKIFKEGPRSSVLTTENMTALFDHPVDGEK